MSISSNFNHKVYKLLKKYYFKVVSKKGLDTRLKYLEKIGLFLYLHFSFVLNEPDLEREIIEIGKSKLKPWENKFQNRSEKKPGKKVNILHIATKLIGIGGHTKVLRTWVEQDTKNNSFVLITNQNIALDDLVEKELKNNTKSLFCVKSEATHLEKSEKILKFIYENEIDLIVLHTHPQDLLPVLTFSIKGVPPVTFFNHADHVFSYGASISDLFLDFQVAAKEYSLKYRNIQSSEILPLIVPKNEFTTQEKNDNEIVFLTMGSFVKYKRFEEFNFLELYKNFLKEHPQITMYFIGVSLEQFQTISAEMPPENMKLMGIIANPSEYLAKAHYFIESFPFASILASYDTCKFGAVPIFSYGTILIYDDVLKNSFPSVEFKTPKNDSEYISFLKEEIKTGSYRKNNKENIRKFFDGMNYEDWMANIYSNIYKVINSEHKVKTDGLLKFVKTEQAKKFARYTTSFHKFVLTEFIDKQDLKNPLLLLNMLKVFFPQYALKGRYKINRSFKR